MTKLAKCIEGRKNHSWSGPHGLKCSLCKVKYAQDRVIKTTNKNDILLHIAKHIEKQGWKVFVIGGERIQQEIGSFKYHYEYVIKFTGVKK